ncbi:hypothetical protein A6A04_14405 [Paramagnetospirillum marisnigri]|uniref:DUF2946 domain-containing protein n=1 Tax=Paramagnetospirillum marisnigri TaxID=1285242 RepID=A0A178MW74_9PROT|nr:DUF2946 family protein [Paramagnetospirillum marisnigri]OAN53146.1 hypothetical protein A6A04_14405 [Paramagnetospirillum marisnigri]
MTRTALATLVLIGLALQGLLPGLDIAFRGDFSRTVFGFDAAMCHSSPSGRAERTADAAPPVEEGQAFSHGCCLVCQTVGLAKAVPPSPTFKTPTAGTAERLIVNTASAWGPGRTSRQHLARAPPLGVA